jgi:membrane-associated phospholipid phosphatase
MTDSVCSGDTFAMPWTQVLLASRTRTRPFRHDVLRDPRPTTSTGHAVGARVCTLLRSLAVSEGVTQALKYTVRRERPDGSGRNSFPSGHAADTFAFATALERHLGWRGAVPAYVLSSYVAASRLHENRHFLSDVVGGAAVGIIAGRTVTRHGREQYSADVQFLPGGAALVIVRQSR